MFCTKYLTQLFDTGEPWMILNLQKSWILHFKKHLMMDNFKHIFYHLWTFFKDNFRDNYFISKSNYFSLFLYHWKVS